MRQALHIFKKDVRYLWYEIAITLALVVMFVGFRWIEFILPIAWCYLAARVIYAEPLPGDRVFWITRPYAWKSLLAAKALFILTFVNLPMIAADVIILYKDGFPVFDNLPGVLWNQVLLTSVFVLPVVVLATVTKGLVQLVMTCLILVVAAMLILPHSAQRYSVPSDWQGLDWMRYSLLIATFVLAGTVIIRRQYKLRRTALARILIVGAVLLVALEGLFFPWAPAFKIQSWFSKLRIDPATVHVALDLTRSMRPLNVWPPPNYEWIHFPIQITGMGDGVEARADAVLLTVGAAGTTSRTGILNGTLFSDGGDRFRLAFQLPRSFLERTKTQPATIKTSFYLTILGDTKSATVPRNNQRVNVPAMGRCAVFREHQLLHCFSPFRDLFDSASLQPASGKLFLVARPTSYSPYPAELGVDPIFQFIHPLDGSPDPVVIVSEMALAHFQKDVEFRDVPLADFVVRPFRPQSR
jgi:hypothetical protein